MVRIRFLVIYLSLYFHSHLMNVIKPDVIKKNKINENSPNVFKIVENHNLALNAAKEIGLHIINIGANDLSSGNV